MSARLIGEMVRIALSAIWANKLRSFLTILGNIVAVTSIIVLVSLIEGINDEVSNAILSQVSADSFMIERVGMVFSEEEFERSRNNPRITLDDAEAIRRFGTNLSAVMAAGPRAAARSATATGCSKGPRSRASPRTSSTSPTTTRRRAVCPRQARFGGGATSRCSGRRRRNGCLAR